MKKVTYFFILIFVFNSCGIFRSPVSKNENIFKTQEQELEYYYAFTEATKLSIFGNFKDAINLYSQCLKYNPKSAAVYYQLSTILLKLGQIDLAKNYAKKSVDLENSNIWYLQNLASIFQLKHNIDSTIIVYKKIVNLNVDNSTHLYNLALLYKENKEYSKALKTIKKIIKIEGLHERLVYLKYSIYENKNAKKKAIKELRKGIASFPDNIDLHGLLAEYYSDIGKEDEADRIYTKIVRLDSTNYKVILSYADFLINNNRGKEAFKYYRDAIYNRNIEIRDKLLIIINLLNNNYLFKSYEKDIMQLTRYFADFYKNDIRVHKLAVDVYLKGNLLNDALDELKFIISKNEEDSNEYEKVLYIENALGNNDSLLYYANLALKKYSEAANLYLFKGIGLMKINDLTKAIDVFKEGINKTNDTFDKVQFFNYLGESFRNIDEQDSSDFYFEKALNIDPKNLIIRNNYAYYLTLRKKNLDRAEKLSELTIKKEPNNAIYLDTYAWVLFQRNEMKPALKYIEKAVKYSDNKNPEILNHYGDILFKLLKYSEALNVWKKAYNIDSTNKELLEKIQNSNNLIN